VNGIAETGQAIGGGDEDVLDAPVLQIGEHAQPEIGPFTAL
jgi:hypothetical protein